MLNPQKTLRQSLSLAGSNQLTETSAEEAAKQAGLPAPMTSPMGQAMSGVNPNVAKMAGTAGQKQASLRQSLQAPDLQSAQREQSGEQFKQLAGQSLTNPQGQQAGSLQKLEQLNPRVQSQANQFLSKLVPPTTGTVSTLTAADPVAQEAIKDLSNPANMDKLVKAVGIDKAADYLAGDNTLSPEAKDKIAQQFNLPAIVGKSLADQVPDNIYVRDINLKDLGYNSPEELASTLGVDPASLNNLSIKQLAEKVTTKINENYHNTQDLLTKVSDPNIGAADRAEARKQLKELGVTGVTGIESKMDDLADSLSRADTINFMGNEMPIEQALSDEKLSGLAVNYFTDDKIKQNIKKNNPELASFLDKYHDVLSDAVSNISTNVAQSAKISYDNKNIGKTKTGELSDSVLSAWMPGYKDSPTAVVPPSIVGILNDTTGYNDAQRTSLYSAINAAEKAGPEALAYLKTLTPSQISSMGLLDTNSSGYKQFTNNIQAQQSIKAIPDVTLNPKALPDALEGASRAVGFNSLNELRDTISKVLDLKQLGYGELPDSLKSFADLLPTGKRVSQWTTQDYTNFVNNLKSRYSKITDQVPNFSGAAQDLKTYASNQTKQGLYEPLVNSGALNLATGNINQTKLEKALDEKQFNIDQLWNDKVALNKLPPVVQDSLINKYAMPSARLKADAIVKDAVGANGPNLQILFNTFANPQNYTWNSDTMKSYEGAALSIIDRLKTSMQSNPSIPEQKATQKLIDTLQAGFGKFQNYRQSQAEAKQAEQTNTLRDILTSASLGQANIMPTSTSNAPIPEKKLSQGKKYTSYDDNPTLSSKYV